MSSYVKLPDAATVNKCTCGAHPIQEQATIIATWYWYVCPICGTQSDPQATKIAAIANWNKKYGRIIVNECIETEKDNHQTNV